MMVSWQLLTSFGVGPGGSWLFAPQFMSIQMFLSLNFKSCVKILAHGFMEKGQGNESEQGRRSMQCIAYHVAELHVVVVVELSGSCIEGVHRETSVLDARVSSVARDARVDMTERVSATQSHYKKDYKFTSKVLLKTNSNIHTSNSISN